MVPKIRRLLVLGLSLFTSSACALTVQTVEDGLLVQGEIVAGDFVKLRAAIDSHPNVAVFLNSNGGRVSEALRVAEYIRTRELATHLPARATCASACVLLFAGGAIRTADPTARIGVHMGSGLLNEEMIEMLKRTYAKYGATGAAVVGAQFEQAAALSTLKQVDFLLRTGVSLRLLRASANVDHLDIRWLTRAEAREFNIVNAD
jgi:hypothetical protein